MAAIQQLIRKADEPETYHGFPVLHLRVGDAIPTPRIPERYAVRVTPDLARYWLNECNHPDQRRVRERKVSVFSEDMDAGAWPLTPESLVFSEAPWLINGQNRLMAVTVHGDPVWFLVDIGWPDELIKYFDRGTARTNSDALKVDGVANYTSIAATITKVDLFHETVGSALVWTARTAPSTHRQQMLYDADPVLWQEAVTIGKAIWFDYRAFAPQTWATAYVVIAQARGERLVVHEFFEEVLAGTGTPDSPSRRLTRKFARIKVSDTKTGDTREPIENIVRAFNAHRTGKRLGFVAQPRFELTRPTTK